MEHWTIAIHYLLQKKVLIALMCVGAGILCGECSSKGEGVSALLNECVSCSNISALLILALGMLIFQFHSL